MCLVHGDEEMTYDALGRHSCGACSEARAKVGRLRRRNRGTGRHPRETLLMVSNEPLRERFELMVENGTTTVAAVAAACGYETRKRGKGEKGNRIVPDIQRLKKQLGLAPVSGEPDPTTGERRLYHSKTLTYDTALRICSALGIEYPAEVGL